MEDFDPVGNFLSIKTCRTNHFALIGSIGVRPIALACYLEHR